MRTSFAERAREGKFFQHTIVRGAKYFGKKMWDELDDEDPREVTGEIDAPSVEESWAVKILLWVSGLAFVVTIAFIIWLAWGSPTW